MIVSLVIAIVGFAVKYYSFLKGTANNNRQQAEFLAGTPQTIEEIRQWKHNGNSPFNINDSHIWVKVPNLMYFAPKTQVTILHGPAAQTAHVGVYDVVDVWKEFPKKDPEIELRNAIGISSLFFLPKNFENTEKLPFAHKAEPGVLKLKRKNAIAHLNEGSGAIIFTGTQLKEQTLTTNEKISNYIKNRQIDVKDWFSDIGEGFTEKTAKAGETIQENKVVSAMAILLIAILIFAAIKIKK